MDAVAIRRKKGGLEVFVVDWKTSDKADEQLIRKWWENATNFRNPLYQCLVYRELLQAHFKRNRVDAKVGIILVPFHQSLPEIIHPGLCVDFQKMDENLLLDGLKKFEWHAVVEESFNVDTIKIPCKLIKGSFNPADYVDESTNYLKGETRLKDILNDNATVADLCASLHLSCIKVESIKKEEKTNEDLEEAATVSFQGSEFEPGPSGQPDDGLTEKQERDEQNRRMKTNVCQCKNTCSRKAGKVFKGCPCRTAHRHCTEACSCNRQKCKNREVGKQSSVEV
ncbi:PREDICTED: uncharacterized protein LOC107335780 [Acropora digitifera]|uniref:uncharacterized protein LOC107335780 n=1 Tax=Acropora digitifera TaxID=70779 RepID=UPI00077A12AA|nr:PREDICTED: uncharacterized protein LOC107335780 [Acropora digitifera]